MRWHLSTLLLTLGISLCHVDGILPRTNLLKQWATTKDSLRDVCRKLQEEWLWISTTIGEPFERQTLQVSLLWEDRLEHAAAALLRATLLAAGYDDSVITLRRRPDFENPSGKSLIVEVTLSAQLHVRLTPAAAATPACNVSALSFVENDQLLRKCEFKATGMQKSEHVIVYIPYQWENTCAAELIKNHVVAFSTTLDPVFVNYSHLKKYVREHRRSFFFLDVDHWSDVSGVQTMEFPRSKVTTERCKLEKTVSLNIDNVFSPALSQAFAGFSPELNDLLEVDHRSWFTKETMEEQACEWAWKQRKKFEPWRKAAVVKPALRIVIVLICKVEEQDLNEYLYLTGLTENLKNIYSSNSTAGQKIKIETFFVDCLDTDWLFRMIFDWYSSNSLSQIAGLVLTEDMATAAAPLAEKFQLPMLTYDVSSYNEPVVRSATGRLKHLDLAIRRLLADCGWRRIGIVSETSRLAESLSDTLRASAAKLVVREVKLMSTDNEGVRFSLKELCTAKARIFIVNTNAATAATVMSIAHEFNLTWDRGYTWIVREYNAADTATAVMRPYSVSFWFRGDLDKVNKIDDLIRVKADKLDLHKELEARWYGRAWPLHAAPLLDALLTIGEGFRRLSSYRRTWFNTRSDGALRQFWDGIQLENIPGINGDLSYDEYGVSAPLIFVRQWGATSKPRLLSIWRSDEWHKSTKECPVPEPRADGSVNCIISVGDPFQRTCNDAVWLTFIMIGSFVSFVLIVASIWWTRHALRAHDHHIQTEYAKRLLARRERVFAVLAEHLVDRSALELHQELGNGRFGRVHLGVLRESGRKCGNVVVAAKALREEATSAEESEFLREACILADLRHDHIVRFMGVCVVDGPPLLLMEHAFFGDLLRYLQNRRYLVGGATSTETITNGIGLEEKAYVSAENLTRFAHEAALALAYIAKSGIVHRDVRASNCLVDERRSLKLADFGLARATGTVDGEYASMRRGMFPVLCMAPESLETGVCSPASDVWAFGVLVFELVTLGRRPYGSQPPSSVMRHVLAGGRPQLPWDASAQTRALVRACWRRAPEARPTAAQLTSWLSTRRRALRPALVNEFVDIDSPVYGKNEVNEPDLDVADIPANILVPVLTAS